MFVAAHFVSALAVVVDYVLTAYMWILIARAVLSWVNPDPYNPIVRFLYRVTEPVLRPIRQRMPPLGGLDFSPMIVLILIVFLQRFLVPSLQELAFSLR